MINNKKNKLCLFKQKNFLAALQEFTTVIDFLESSSEALYNEHDDFIAHYNRY